MKMTITRRARHALKSADKKASEIARQHRDTCQNLQGLERTEHRLKTGHVLWAISVCPHDQILLDSPPPGLPRSLSSFLQCHSKDLLEFLSLVGKEEVPLSSR